VVDFVLGMMSGSSLDGLDLAVCRFQLDKEGEIKVSAWEIMAAETDPFPPMWKARLRSAPHLPGRELWRLHADLGHWIGQRARAFLDKHPDFPVSLVGSHGHTIFHDPQQKFTTQIGDGAAVALRLGLPVVTELRGSDVAAGGQGAPLAPLADKYLFPEYDGFLNLGGIANLSLQNGSGNYIAGDISGCCQVLDRLAARTGATYDAGGALARKGSPAPAIAQTIAALPYHQLPYPKSLDNAWVREQLWPLLDDKSEQLRANQDEAQPSFEFIVGNTDTTDFKEAALIALAALFRTEGISNALVSATGAERQTVNGALFHP